MRMGRWLSRDPIGERGGLGLYGFVLNSPFKQVDSLGLVVCNKANEGAKQGVSSGTSFSPGEQNPDDVKQAFDIILAALILSDIPIPGATDVSDLANKLNPNLPWGMDVAAVALQLAEFNKLLRLTAGVATVWTKVKCQECVCVNWFTGWPLYRTKTAFAWKDSGDEHWVKCDLSKTEWGAARKKMPGGTVGMNEDGGIVFDMLQGKDVEKIRKQCDEQAKDACVK